MWHGRRESTRHTRYETKDDNGTQWYHEYGRKHWVVRLEAKRPEDWLLNDAAIAIERDLSLAAVRRYFPGRKHSSAKRTWRKRRVKLATWRGTPHTLVDPSGNKVTILLFRRGDLPAAASGVRGRNAERFIYDGEWHVTKNYAIQKKRLPRGDRSVAFRTIYSPITGFRVEVCNESALNVAIARLTAGPPELKTGPSKWASEFLEELMEVYGRRIYLKRVVDWRRLGCIFLDGDKLSAEQEKTGRKRWYVDAGQASKILEGVAAYRKQTLPEHRKWVSQIEAKWAYGIGAHGYLLHQAIKRDAAADAKAKRMSPKRTKRVGRFLLYLRTWLDTLKKEIDGEPLPDGVHRTIQIAAKEAAVSRSRLKSAIFRKTLSAEKSVKPGTLKARINIVSGHAVSDYLASPSKRGWPPADCPDGYVLGTELRAMPEFRSWGIGYALADARKLGIPYLTLPGLGSRARFAYLRSRVLPFLRTRDVGNEPSPREKPVRGRGRPSDWTECHKYVAARKREDPNATIRALMIEFKSKHTDCKIAINNATVATARMALCRLRAVAQS
jgi:hypothetical protein